VSLIVTVGPTSLSAAAECQVTEDGGTIQGVPTWTGATSNIFPLTITVARDIYGGRIPSPVLEITPYMNSSRIGLVNTGNQEIATIGVCLSQDIRDSALFNRAMIPPIGTTQAKAHTKAKKVFIPPYKGDKHVFMVRATSPDIGISVRNTPRTIIGPVQEFQKPILSDERSVSQSVAALPATVEFSSLFGGQPFVAVNQFQDALQLPDNESLRMNRTTTQVLHSGNCASGCP
jgi:hypothetical protein